MKGLFDCNDGYPIHQVCAVCNYFYGLIFRGESCVRSHPNVGSIQNELKSSKSTRRVIQHFFYARDTTCFGVEYTL